MVANAAALTSGLGTLLTGLGAVLGFFYGTRHAEAELRKTADPDAICTLFFAASPSAESAGKRGDANAGRAVSQSLNRYIGAPHVGVMDFVFAMLFAFLAAPPVWAA